MRSVTPSIVATCNLFSEINCDERMRALWLGFSCPLHELAFFSLAPSSLLVPSFSCFIAAPLHRCSLKRDHSLIVFLIPADVPLPSSLF